MLIGVYGDVHLTKNMRSLQSIWDTTAMKSIYNMYDKFDEMSVEAAVCLGDFFDKPMIEAKHMQLVMPILNHIDQRTYPTYILLGNHEIDSDSSNILDFLSNWNKIIPVTELSEIEGMVFIPYNVDPTTVDISGKIVFTHHDIYGSDLAGGKTRAFFGLDPSIFKDARLVMNGHVHLRSNPAKNILNAGSLLISQQGELKVGTFPQYYVLDTKSCKYHTIDNKYSMIFLTSPADKIDEVIEAKYDNSNLVLKVEYSGEIPDIPINTLHTSYRKISDSISSDRGELVRANSFDINNYLRHYIESDQGVPDFYKEEYIRLGLELLS